MTCLEESENKEEITFEVLTKAIHVGISNHIGDKICTSYLEGDWVLSPNMNVSSYAMSMGFSAVKKTSLRECQS